MAETKKIEIKTVVESKTDAVIHVERLEIPLSAKRRLSTNVIYLEAMRPAPSSNSKT